MAAIRQQGLGRLGGGKVLASSRSIWLRRVDPSDPLSLACGDYWNFALTAIGNAAARETFLTNTSHMAAIWSDLFESMVAPGSELRWLHDGPGVGRDARIAYSSLLGRYMARAYLTEREGVRALLPLDVAKRRLEGTSYEIRKEPPSRGLEADWIGMDNDGLVIVEAKGRYHDRIGIRSGRPPVLKTAISQVERTAVFERYTGKRLPVKRWAIVSRWGTEQNGYRPTLIAWDPEDEGLSSTDYREISRIFFRADVDGVLTGMGHWATSDTPDALAYSAFPPEVRIRVGREVLEAGWAAAIGPFGIQPIRDGDNIAQLEGVREVNANVAIASLSSDYVTNSLSGDEQVGTQRYHNLPVYEDLDAIPAIQHIATRAGLTVAWPAVGEEVVLLTS